LTAASVGRQDPERAGAWSPIRFGKRGVIEVRRTASVSRERAAASQSLHRDKTQAKAKDGV